MLAQYGWYNNFEENFVKVLSHFHLWNLYHTLLIVTTKYGRRATDKDD